MKSEVQDPLMSEQWLCSSPEAAAQTRHEPRGNAMCKDLNFMGWYIFFESYLLPLDLLLREKEKALSGANWKRSLSFGDALHLGSMLWKKASVPLSYHSARAQGKGIEDGLYMSKRKAAGDLHICFFGKQCCFQYTYGTRTCKLKPNGTQALQHSPLHAPNCVWQDSRWCVNVKRICLDLFLHWIPQAAFKLRKAYVHCSTNFTAYICEWRKHKGTGVATQKRGRKGDLQKGLHAAEVRKHAVSAVPFLHVTIRFQLLLA